MTSFMDRFGRSSPTLLMSVGDYEELKAYPPGSRYEDGRGRFTITHWRIARGKSGSAVWLVYGKRARHSPDRG
jgi:hypothetical protein